MMPRLLRIAASLALSASIGWASPSSADTAADFFKGRSIRFTVVYEPGGTYDLYSRLVATHLPKYIPGNPSIVVQYMPGAGGLVGTLNLYEKAAADGSVLGMVPRDLAINQMLHPEDARYDARKFRWLGSIAGYTGAMFVATRTGVKSAEDLHRIEVVVGSWGNTTESYITPKLLNALAGMKFRVVTGYRGAPDVDLAVERGEVDSRVSSWTALKTQRAQWLSEGKVTVPFQTGLKRHPDLPQLPLVTDLATDEQGRRILEFMNADSGIGWSVIAPPNIPEDRLAVLRQAFQKMVTDREFLAEARLRGLEIVPSSGEEVEATVARTLATPPQALATLKQIIGSQK
jgi:tripartite-type tricarboxylate transporter receptor subunit TctC